MSNKSLIGDMTEEVQQINADLISKLRTEQERGERASRVLELKRKAPEYQRLELDVKEGGRSLLHDEFGMPKVGPAKEKSKMPKMQEISNEPVNVRASVPDESKVVMHKTRSVGKSQAVLEQDDGFIPPKSNFVSVGQIDHSWYDEKVSGQAMVDNNEDVDIDQLQGVNPLADVHPDLIDHLKVLKNKILNTINSAKILVAEASSLEELSIIKENTLGSNSLIVQWFKSLKPQDRVKMGEFINTLVEDFLGEFSNKEQEVLEEEEILEQEKLLEQEVLESSQANEILEEGYQEGAEFPCDLKQGECAILVDNKLYSILVQEFARSEITKLLLRDNIDIERIQLIKRVPIEFGVLLGD